MVRHPEEHTAVMAAVWGRFKKQPLDQEQLRDSGELAETASPLAKRLLADVEYMVGLSGNEEFSELWNAGQRSWTKLF